MRMPIGEMRFPGNLRDADTAMPSLGSGLFSFHPSAIRPTAWMTSTQLFVLPLKTMDWIVLVEDTEANGVPAPVLIVGVEPVLPHDEPPQQ